MAATQTHVSSEHAWSRASLCCASLRVFRAVCLFVCLYVCMYVHVCICMYMSCHVTSCHVMSCHVMSCHVMSCHLISSHLMSCHVMSCHVMSCHVNPLRVVFQHLTRTARHRLSTCQQQHNSPGISRSGYCEPDRAHQRCCPVAGRPGRLYTDSQLGSRRIH